MTRRSIIAGLSALALAGCCPSRENTNLSYQNSSLEMAAIIDNAGAGSKISDADFSGHAILSERNGSYEINGQRYALQTRELGVKWGGKMQTLQLTGEDGRVFYTTTGITTTGLPGEFSKPTSPRQMQCPELKSLTAQEMRSIYNSLEKR